MLGANIQCDQLIILTAIDYVYINFNTENQQPLKTINVDELKRYIDENQFAKGSMLPKIEAAISFIENNPKGSVLITSLNELDAALEGKVGTVIKSNWIETLFNYYMSNAWFLLFMCTPENNASILMRGALS